MSRLGSAGIDASRRPKFAELLRLASRRSCSKTGRARHTRALGQRRRPFRRGPWLWNALPRTISRRGSPMPGLDARGAGCRPLSGRRTLLGRPCGRANVAVARRRHRPSAGGPRSRGGRSAGRASRGTVAHYRARGAHYRDRSFAPRRLGARRQHALWTGLALFEIATARFASSCGFLAGLLGRGALRATGRQALHDSRRARDRADRGGAWAPLRRRPHRRGDQAGPSSGRRPFSRPSATGASQTRPRAKRPSTISFAIGDDFPVGAADCPCSYSRPWILQQGEIACPPSIVSSSCCAMARANGT